MVVPPSFFSFWKFNHHCKACSLSGAASTASGREETQRKVKVYPQSFLAPSYMHRFVPITLLGSLLGLTNWGYNR